MATNDKYDRQLRLWGAEGQRALAHAHLLCLGSSAVATEVLKNLVLPGVGAFTIVDDALVNSDDLSGNFFLEFSDLGKPRAAAVLPRLMELNPDIRGFSVISDPAVFLKSPQANSFDLVIVANKTVDPEFYVDKFPCSMEICTAGFLGSVRLFADEHVVLDARAEERNFPDLRLRSPWAELSAFSGDVRLAELDDKDHSHVPWAVILLKALQAIGNCADFPTLKKQVLEMRRSSDEENFNEALENLHVALHAGTLSEETEDVFASLERELGDRKFLVVGRAVKKFHEKHGRLPLSGKIPDMVADTRSFLALQRLYQDKAERDFQEVWKFLDNFDDESYARRLVKHAGELRVMKMRGNLKEFPIEDPEDEAAQQGLRIYKALKGAEVAAELEEEISRSRAVELHAVCAVLGGVAAQEATKLLTKIFTPLDNVFVFNGVTGEGVTLKIAE